MSHIQFFSVTGTRKRLTLLSFTKIWRVTFLEINKNNKEKPDAILILGTTHLKQTKKAKQMWNGL